MTGYSIDCINMLQNTIWLDSLPSYWEVRKLKTLGLITAGGVNKKIEENQLLVKSIHYMDVYKNSGKCLYYSEDYLQVSATESQVFTYSLKIGDALFTSSSETPEDIGHCSVVGEPLEGVLYGYHLARFRSDFFDWGYSKYYFNSHNVRCYFSSVTNGITRYSLNYDDFKELVALVPPMEEQKAIAAFLDNKTAQIDALIADKQRMIDLLQERRQALITEVVTKGLDRNVPMKDSGVEWIGEIPEGWEVINLQRVITDITNGITRRGDYCEHGQIVLRIRDVSDGKIDYDEPNRFCIMQSEEQYKIQNGDILFVRVNGSADLVGKCAVFTQTTEPVYYNDHIMRVRIDKSTVDSEYVALYLATDVGKSEIKKGIKTAAGQKTISRKGINDIKLVLPPLVVQKEIVCTMHVFIKDIEELSSQIHASIRLLADYRQSIITEAVTGKICVGEVAS